MKILLVLNYGWRYGGGETYTFVLKDSLIRMGHDVRVFSSNNTGIGEELESDYLFPESKIKALKVFTSFFNPVSLIYFKRALKDFNPDLVHINSISSEVTPSILLSLWRIPTVMTLHSRYVFYPDENTSSPRLLYERFRAFFRRRLIFNVDRFISPSKYMASISPRWLKPIQTLNTGIAPLQSVPVKNYHTLLYVGRIAEEKGVRVLIEAMSILSKTNPEITLNIVGDGPEMESYKNLLQKYNLNSKVYFKGRASRKDLQRWYINATVVIQPSIVDECFPLTCIEAISVGRPVIGSNNGGIPEIIKEGLNGLLVKPNNKEELAGKVNELMSNKREIDRMSKEAMALFAHYDITNHTHDLYGLYEELAQLHF